jgi:hypothetical protein
MRIAIVDAAALLAAQNAGGYPCCFCQGMSMPPMAVASATAEPDTPPNTQLPTTLVDVRPPRYRCTSIVANATIF